MKTHRKTIEGGDIIEAMKKTGFENYAEALRPYLDAYRAEYRKKASPSKSNDRETSTAASQDEEDTRSSSA